MQIRLLQATFRNTRRVQDHSALENSTDVLVCCVTSACGSTQDDSAFWPPELQRATPMRLGA